MSAEDLDRALGAAERILLDSSALIAFHSPSEATHALAQHTLRRVQDDSDPLHGYFSVVSAIELLVRPIRTDHERFTFMHTFLMEFPNLTVLPVDVAVATQAATLRATLNLALPDAIVVASGLLAGCEVIVSNDQRWQQRGATAFPQFRWIYLQDHV